MRLLSVAMAALVGLAVGCTSWAFVLNPPSGHLVDVETWTDVPEDQQKVQARVGEALHLPVGPTIPEGPVACQVNINGQKLTQPEYSVSMLTISYIFRAEQPGEYHVESINPLDAHGYSRGWVITVKE